MASVQVALAVSEFTSLDRIRRQDRIDAVLLASTFLEMPRAGAVRKIGERVHRAAPDADVLPYAWWMVSHRANELPTAGRRSVRGDGGDEVAEGWAASVRAAAALNATRLVLRTPASLAPGPRGRRLLGEFVEKARTDKLGLLWQPSGLWEPAEITQIAQSLSLEVLVAAPPRELPEFERRWLLVGAPGAPPVLDRLTAEDLAESALDAQGATIVFTGAAALRNLREFRQALEDAQAAR